MTTEYMTRIGFETALKVIKNNPTYYAKCEGCNLKTQVFDCESGSTVCPVCFISELQEWEERIGSVSEFLFHESFGRTPDENSRAYKVAMDTYWKTLGMWFEQSTWSKAK